MRSKEAFWWSLFSAGGVLSALIMPAVVVTTFLLPARGGMDAIARIHGLLAPWPVRLVLFGVLFFSLIHCAHRIRHVLMDLGLRGNVTALSVVCYAGALAGAGVAAFVLVGL